ncbi:hypothetical protein EV175_000475 [Coemansia sp. RSA 1933]|nr:hypothetical protein EV175_000475 [Coemansia sp. RSA 1933]
MTELVTYEDSPLAQYLQEIEATEEPVVESHPYKDAQESDTDDLAVTANSGKLLAHWKITVATKLCVAKINIADLLARFLGPSEKTLLSDITAVTWDVIVNTLALSGHLAERYTPKPARRYEIQTDLKHWNNALTMRSLAGVSAGGLLTSLMVGHRMAANRPIVGVFMAVAVTFTVLRTAKRRSRIEKSTLASEACINSVKELSARSRILDITTQKAMRFIQEITFVSKGFRASQYAGVYRISSQPGQGTLWVAKNLQQTTAKSLVLCIQTLFDTLDATATAASIEQQAVVFDLRNKFETMAESNPDKSSTLEHLQSLFELHFTTRKIWLKTILARFEPAYTVDNMDDRNALLSILENTTADITPVLRVVNGAIDGITRAREAQFTAKSWEALSENTKGSDASTSSYRSAVRCLASMTSTIDTITAKLVVCKSTIEPSEESEGRVDGIQDVPFDEVARVFASLKADIDVLAGLYQEAMTSLTMDSDGADSTTVILDQGYDRMQDTADDGDINMSDILEGTQVFRCTPFDTSDMNTSDLVFEADSSNDQLTRRKGGQQPALDRSERIRLQKQNREKEAEARRKAGEVHSMMSELKTAIGTRGKKKEDAAAAD